MSLFENIQSFAYSKENNDHFLDVDMQAFEACRKAMIERLHRSVDEIDQNVVSHI